MIDFVISQSQKMSHGWYETHVLRSLKFYFLIKIVFFCIFKTNTHNYNFFQTLFAFKKLEDISRLMVLHDLNRFSGSKDILC